MTGVVSSIGRIVSRYNVEQAVVTTLQTWLETYLSEVERQNALAAGALKRPPGNAAFSGGLDFLSFEPENTPALIVAAQPFEDAELRGSGDYDQWYEVEIAAVVADQDEPTTRTLADHYGAAVMAAIAQNGSLGGLSTRTRLVEAPRTEFLDPRIRRVAHSICVFHTFVESVVNETDGPSAPVPDGQLPPGAPEVVNTTLTVTAAPISSPLTAVDPNAAN